MNGSSPAWSYTVCLDVPEVGSRRAHESCRCQVELPAFHTQRWGFQSGFQVLKGLRPRPFGTCSWSSRCFTVAGCMDRPGIWWRRTSRDDLLIGTAEISLVRTKVTEGEGLGDRRGASKVWLRSGWLLPRAG